MKKLKGEIVLIDNEDYEEELLIEVLQKLNYQAVVKYFNNAAHALDYLKNTTKQIFMILSDINMTPMDGFGLKGKIDADPVLREKSIPFVFTSTLTSQHILETAYK